jgi:hypothetical protein
LFNLVLVKSLVLEFNGVSPVDSLLSASVALNVVAAQLVAHQLLLFLVLLGHHVFQHTLRLLTQLSALRHRSDSRRCVHLLSSFLLLRHNRLPDQ